MNAARALNQLAVEYQSMYRDANGNVRLANSVNHTDPFRPSCVFGPGFREKLDDLGFVETRVLTDDTADAAVISFDKI